MKKVKGQMSESLVLGLLLALAGGFFDAYTYLCRGGVFANAETGNIVLLGAHLAEGDFEKALRYLLPIVAFAFGVLSAELVKLPLQVCVRTATSTSTGVRSSFWAKWCS